MGVIWKLMGNPQILPDKPTFQSHIKHPKSPKICIFTLTAPRAAVERPTHPAQGTAQAKQSPG